MAERQRAFFIYGPRRLGDLMGIHPSRSEKRFIIQRRVSLSTLDYDNFTNDLWADRSYLEGFFDNTWDADYFRCIFVHRRGRKDGLLIVPTPDGHVRYAAYWVEHTESIGK